MGPCLQHGRNFFVLLLSYNYIIMIVHKLLFLSELSLKFFCYHYHYSSKSDSCLIVHPYVQRINDQLNPHASFCQFVKSVCTAKNLALVIESAHNYHMIYIRISLVVQCLVVGRRWKLKQTCAFDRTLQRLLIQTPAFSLPSLASFSKSPYVEIQNPDSCFDTKHNKATITTKQIVCLIKYVLYHA